MNITAAAAAAAAADISDNFCVWCFNHLYWTSLPESSSNSSNTDTCVRASAHFCTYLCCCYTSQRARAHHRTYPCSCCTSQDY